MAQSFVCNYVHIVFSPRYRQSLIPQQLQPRLWAYLAGIAKNIGVAAIEIGGAQDHVHLLLALPSDLSIAKAVNLLKSNSSKWLNLRRRGFSWQKGYGAFSVSASNLDAVRRYIRDQEQHHAKRDFDDEFRALLKRHGLRFEERYLLG